MDITFRKILADSVRARYTTENNPGPISVADGVFVASLSMCDNNVYGSESHVTAHQYCYSEICSEFTGATQLPVDTVLKRLLSEADFGNYIQLLNTLADSQKDIVIIGYGGMMINLIYIWNYMSRYINRPIFKTVSVFEDDNLSYSNLWRLLKSPTKFRLPYYVKSINKTLLLDDKYFASTVNVYTRRFTGSDVVDGAIYIGAPDFETREVLSNHNFLSILHADNDITIVSKPVVDSSITSETYGLIDVNVLFPNIYMASVKTLDVINKNEYPTDAVLWTYSAGGSMTQTCEVQQ